MCVCVCVCSLAINGFMVDFAPRLNDRRFMPSGGGGTFAILDMHDSGAVGVTSLLACKPSKVYRFCAINRNRCLLESGYK